MSSNPVRIIIDTNLWISFLITKDFDKLDEILFVKKGILVFSEELLEEFLEVVKRPKFRRFFNQTDIEDIIDTIDEHADFIEVKTKTDVCRDKKDNFLLALSKDGNADFILTGDNDLLNLETFEGTKIMTISDFLKSFE